MTLPDPAAPRKSRRLWLIAPYAVLLIAVGVWSVVWLQLRDRAAASLDAQAQTLRAKGYELAWSERRISGYPFRLNADFTDLKVTEPSGWAIQAPVLKAEAEVFDLGHWVAAAPQGITLVRPIGGPVTITAKALRASIAGLDRYPPRLSVEGADLIFTPGPGARPYPLRTARALQLHVRPGPDDQAALLVRADDAQARFGGFLDQVTQDKSVSLLADVVISKAGALQGGGWRRSVRNWAAAGGRITVRQAYIRSGDGGLTSKAGDLTVNADGRLEGRMQAALSGGGSSLVTSDIVFKDGVAKVGPLPIGPAPRLY